MTSALASSHPMRVAIFRGARDVGLESRGRPVVGEGEVLVRLVASGICGSDLHRYRGNDTWSGQVSFPRSGGHEMAGVIHALGPGSAGWEIGQPVAIEPMQLTGCGACVYCRRGATNLCANRAGLPGRRASTGFAEFDVANIAQLHPITDGSRFEEAALADVYACAIHALHRVPITAGMTVAVIGTGAVGLALGQAIRQRGGRVFLMGRYRPILEVAIAIGATDEVMLVGQEGASGREPSGRGGADVVFEAAGGVASESGRLAVELSRPGATIGVLGAFVGDLRLPYQIANRKELTVRFCNGYAIHEGRSEFQLALDLIRGGTVNALALITHRFPLSDVAEAFRVADDKARSGAIKVMLNPVPVAWDADSDEAGRLFQSEVGHAFQLDGGHPTDLITAG